MPVGVEVSVDDGVATVVFTDRVLRRGRGVGLLLESADDPDQVKRVTYPEFGYLVPEEVARRAGFIDSISIPTDPFVPVEPVEPFDQGGLPLSQVPADPPAGPVDPPPADPDAPGPNSDDGKPDMDWHRTDIDAYAQETFGLDVTGLPNKTEALKAIRDAETHQKG